MTVLDPQSQNFDKDYPIPFKRHKTFIFTCERGNPKIWSVYHNPKEKLEILAKLFIYDAVDYAIGIHDEIL
jgi:hypothetical protein